MLTSKHLREHARTFTRKFLQAAWANEMTSSERSIQIPARATQPRLQPDQTVALPEATFLHLFVPRRRRPERCGPLP
jgi:hypothetical protein